MTRIIYCFFDHTWEMERMEHTVHNLPMVTNYKGKEFMRTARDFERNIAVYSELSDVIWSSDDAT